MDLELFIRGNKTFVDVEYENYIGVYGSAFWALVNDNKYEPETFDFIQRNFQNKAYFVDIGAATGCMSIYAAQLGYKVFSIEPQERVFEALKRNLTLNKDIQDRVELVNALVVAGEDIQISRFFSDGASGPLEDISPSIQTVNLVDLVTNRDFGTKIVLKMDIEGAEFNLLSDHQVLKVLKTHTAVLFLSLHPGFLNPIKSNSVLAKVLWRTEATIEVLKLYLNLRKHSTIFDSSGTQTLNFFSVLFRLKRKSRDFQINFG